MHVFLRHVDLGLDLQQAIDAPEFHMDHLISSFYPRGFARRSVTIEERFGDEVADDLRRRGHEVRSPARGRSAASPPWRARRTGCSRRVPIREGCRATRPAASLTRMSELLCPTDGTALRRIERSGVHVDACPSCRGVWLDRGELDKIVERERSDLDDFETGDPRHARPRSRLVRRRAREAAQKKKRGGFLEEFLDFG